MKYTRIYPGLLAIGFSTLLACGGEDPSLNCGEGTIEQDGACIPESTLNCGEGTIEQDGACVPESTLSCGEGTIEQDGACLIAPSEFETLWEGADDTLSTPELGGEDFLRGELPTALDDSLEFTFQAEAGQWFSLALFSESAPAADFVIHGPDGTDFRRQNPLQLQSVPQRYIMAPVSGEYTLSIHPRDTSGGRFIAHLEQIEAPEPTPLGVDASGHLLDLRDNLYALSVDAGEEVIELTFPSLGSDAQAFLEVFDSAGAHTDSYTLTAGDTVHIPASTEPRLLLVDYDRANGLSLDYQLQTQSVCTTAGAPFGGGEGTEQSPFTVCSLAHLAAVFASDDQHYPLKHYALTRDLDLSELTDDYIADPEAFEFFGAFHGKLHTLSNLTFEDAALSSLFHYIAEGGIVRDLYLDGFQLSNSTAVAPLASTNSGLISNVHVINSTVESTEIEAGGLISFNRWGRIENSSSSATVSCVDACGGLVGYNNGRIIESSASGDITGDEAIGGLTGVNEDTIEFSFATGRVEGVEGVGGLVGLNYDDIEDSYATGDVFGEVETGGFAGYNDGDIRRSHSSSSVEAQFAVGGLVGFSEGYINQSYSTGTVVGEEQVGGLAGLNDNGIFASYSSASVSGRIEVGGLVGKNRDYIENSHATGDVSGESQVGGLIGYTSSNTRKSWATGNVTGITNVGGLIGHNEGMVEEAYATGDVSGTSAVGGFIGLNNNFVDYSYAFGAATADSDLGGFIGLEDTSSDLSTFCYYNDDRNDSDPSDAVALTEAEFSDAANFQGWDFSETWEIDTSLNLPVLQYEPESEGGILF